MYMFLSSFKIILLCKWYGVFEQFIIVMSCYFFLYHFGFAMGFPHVAFFYVAVWKSVYVIK